MAFTKTKFGKLIKIGEIAFEQIFILILQQIELLIIKLQKCENAWHNLAKFLNSERWKSVYIISVHLVDVLKSFQTSIYY